MSNNPTDFTKPHEPEYQVQHMTEDFKVWNTLKEFDSKQESQQFAKNYARGNPDIEVQIVKTHKFNY